MSDLYQDVERGKGARRILEAPEWSEAWDSYRLRILEEIEAAKSNDAETVMHLKRLLSAGNAARAHLERLVKEGEIALHSIELDEKQSKLRKLFGR